MFKVNFLTMERSLQDVLRTYVGWVYEFNVKTRKLILFASEIILKNIAVIHFIEDVKTDILGNFWEGHNAGVTLGRFLQLLGASLKNFIQICRSYFLYFHMHSLLYIHIYVLFLVKDLCTYIAKKDIEKYFTKHV